DAGGRVRLPAQADRRGGARGPARARPRRGDGDRPADGGARGRHRGAAAARRVLARRPPRPHAAGERDPVVHGGGPVEPGDRRQAGDRRRDREEPRALHLPQARRRRPDGRGRHRAARRDLPVTPRLPMSQHRPGPGLMRGLVDRDGEVALLLDVIQLTAAGTGLVPLAAEVARLITDATATAVCFVHVLDDTEGSLTLAGATPPFDRQVGRVRLPLGVGISGWVAKHRTPVVLPEGKESDPRYLPIPELRGTDFVSMASIPMEIDPGGLVGVLNVHTVERREFLPRDVELLRVIGRLVAGALNQARLHRRLAARERMHERFVERVIATQEAEHRRMAGDIHGGISQRLIGLSYHPDAASHAAGGGDTAEVTAQLAQARTLLGLALDEARSAIGGLRPPVLDDLGLAGGLASLARSTPQIETEVELADHRLPEHVEI